MFRNLKLRGRKAGCLGCDPGRTCKAQHEASAVACGTEEIDGDSRITVKALQQAIEMQESYVLIDTRPEVEFGIASLPNSISESFSLLCEGSVGR